ncbi:MAG: CDP-alcohol phosphatidyltransferase family protein [Gemmatimonadaceae bacterium]|jgi:phosphatidylglycerophosphate synthase|nr:CDP-alcohol phosphatidyltransferase family protein [Gemmatimonadaceae bacterium]
MKRAIVWGLSASRVLLVPLVLAAVHRGDDDAAIVLLFVAAASDVLDGALARRWRVASDAGARMDASADAVLLLSVLWALADRGRALHAPLLLSLACFLHFITTPRGVTRYDPIGRHLGTTLYIAVSLLLGATDAWVAPIMLGVGTHALLTLWCRLRPG